MGTLDTLVSRHRALREQYDLLVRHRTRVLDQDDLEALEAQLERLERRIVEYRARGASEFRRKLCYIREISGNDPYIDVLLRAAVRSQ